MLAVNISQGSPIGNEDYQSMTFTVDFVSGNANLFAAGLAPSLTNTGAMQFTLVPFENGNVTFNVFLMDDGGQERNGIDTSTFQTITVSVLPVNNIPYFSIPSNLTVLENEYSAVAYSSVFATGISAGPLNEIAQGLTFTVTFVGDIQFVELPHMLPDGTLEFRTAQYTFGTAMLKISLIDDGGIVRGGINTTTEELLSLTVFPVNQAPTFQTSAPSLSIWQDQSVPGFVYNVSAGPNEQFQTLSFVIQQVSGPNLLADPPFISNGSLSLALDHANYRPAVIELAITLKDDGPGGTVNGDRNISDVVTLTINLLFVNHAPSFRITDYMPTVPA
eukprot:1674941-Rhodomonas_salina.1